MIENDLFKGLPFDEQAELYGSTAVLAIALAADPNQSEEFKRRITRDACAYARTAAHFGLLYLDDDHEGPPDPDRLGVII